MGSNTEPEPAFRRASGVPTNATEAKSPRRHDSLSARVLIVLLSFGVKPGIKPEKAPEMDQIESLWVSFPAPWGRVIH